MNIKSSRKLPLIGLLLTLSILALVPMSVRAGILLRGEIRGNSRAMVDGTEIGHGKLGIFEYNQKQEVLSLADLTQMVSDDPLVELLAPFMRGFSGDRLQIKVVPANAFATQQDIAVRRSMGSWESFPIGPLIAEICERQISEGRREVELHLYRNKDADPKAGSEVVVALAQGPTFPGVASAELVRSLRDASGDEK